ncbi:class F sortase [Amycolatopsis keratiniphila]|uniref:class F sortase n=1 Tax=Amycolatopsis keratiniphila TaxID=129921 RepID=UPI00087B339C|nr:class F sortase [Amycolatopsis keratiniphila]OLZ59743.1 class F sortase [Amycolatopsis keratiniphila subsp. nogabecina]SDU55129.1 Sortase family protein [Amycolatopsis keratiniphila]
MIRPSWRRWPVPLVVGTLIGVVLAAALTACAVPPPGKVASPAPPSPVSSVAEAPPLAPAKPARLEIPAIGVRAGAIVDLGLAGDGTLEVPNDAVTAGWFTGGPAPGEVGPAVLAGHVDYKKVPGVFVRLKELKAGDEALVHREDGITAVFTVYAVERHPKASFPTEKVYGDTTGPELRLITCGGDFDSSTGNYLDNVVAFAKLTRV